jgi:hypothetical protein
MSGMHAKDLRAQLALNEDSTRRFKADVKNAASLASEMAVYTNDNGGKTVIGVADDGSGLKQVPEHWSTIDFSGGHDGCLFTATVRRKPAEEEIALIHRKGTSMIDSRRFTTEQGFSDNLDRLFKVSAGLEPEIRKQLAGLRYE